MTIKDNYTREVYRKLFHLSSIWIPILIWFLPFNQSLILFAILFVLLLACELLRVHSKKFYQFYLYCFGNYMRDHEKNDDKSSFVGSYYVMLGALLAVLLFSQMTAITAIAIMVVSDAFAALIGRKFGKTKIMDKSLEGSLAFVVSGFITVFGIYYCCAAATAILYSGCFAVLIAALVEMFSSKLKVDDNLSIILAAGFAMELVLFFIQ